MCGASVVKFEVVRLSVGSWVHGCTGIPRRPPGWHRARAQLRWPSWHTAPGPHHLRCCVLKGRPQLPPGPWSQPATPSPLLVPPRLPTVPVSACPHDCPGRRCRQPAAALSEAKACLESTQQAGTWDEGQSRAAERAAEEREHRALAARNRDAQPCSPQHLSRRVVRVECWLGGRPGGSGRQQRRHGSGWAP